MSYGVFEAASTDGLERHNNRRQAEHSLDAAIFDAREQFGTFLGAAKNKQDFEDRLALIKPDLMRTVEAHTMPVTGVMRRVSRALRPNFESRRKRALTLTDQGVRQEVRTRLDNGELPADIIESVGDQIRSQTGTGDQQFDLLDTLDDAARTARRKRADDRGTTTDTGMLPAPSDMSADPTAGGMGGDPTPGASEPTTTTDPAIPTARRRQSISEDAKELIPKDDWEGYLKERSTPETKKIKDRNFETASFAKGAPFADYKDFADCVSKNSDKDDPNAYCGSIKHKVEDDKTSSRRNAVDFSELDLNDLDDVDTSPKPVTDNPYDYDYGRGRDKDWGDEDKRDDKTSSRIQLSARDHAAFQREMRAYLRRTADDSTAGEPTRPNTVNDDVLEGIDEGSSDKVSDSIDTNTGDGSDSSGKNPRKSNRKTAGSGFVWNDAGDRIYGKPTWGGREEDPNAEIMPDADDDPLSVRADAYRDEGDSGETSYFATVEEAQDWCEQKMLEYEGGQGSLFGRKNAVVDEWGVDRPDYEDTVTNSDTRHPDDQWERDDPRGKDFAPNYQRDGSRKTATGFSPDELDEMKSWAYSFGFVSDTMLDVLSAEDIIAIVKKEYPGGLIAWQQDAGTANADIGESSVDSSDMFL